jgi:undecaprenyl diphosphate synthase
MTKTESIPSHIGIILDGNRRWAKIRGKTAQAGHRKGYQTLKDITDIAFDKGINYVSAYIFSTENWKRTSDEVGFLMDLALRMVVNDLQEIQDKNIRVVWLGSTERVSEKLQKALKNAVEATKNNTRGTLALCFNYGGQQEIAEAAQAICATNQPITIESISSHLYGADVPPIDLVIRTSGEHRMSNFMLWRAAYSELYFTDVLWPDFSEADLDKAIEDYSQRHRRFGG